jgi:hypothetical protein
MDGAVGGILESYDVNSTDLALVGGTNCFEIVNANWFTQPWTSSQWADCTVYVPAVQTCTYDSQEQKYKGFTPTPSTITINKIAAGDVKIGYQVGGSHYSGGYQLW